MPCWVGVSLPLALPFCNFIASQRNVTLCQRVYIHTMHLARCVVLVLHANQNFVCTISLHVVVCLFVFFSVSWIILLLLLFPINKTQYTVLLCFSHFATLFFHSACFQVIASCFRPVIGIIHAKSWKGFHLCLQFSLRIAVVFVFSLLFLPAISATTTDRYRLVNKR